MSHEELPPITEALIQWLQELYPDRVPQLDTPDREVWAAVGEQTVIARLRLLLVDLTEESR